MAKTKGTAESKTTQAAPSAPEPAPTAARGNGRQADDTGPQSNGEEGMMAFALREAGIGESDEAPPQAKQPRAAKPKPAAEDDSDVTPAADDPETNPDDRLPAGEIDDDEDDDEPAAEEDGAVSIPDDDDDDGSGTGGEGEDDDSASKGERRLSDLPEWAQQEIRDKIKLREQRRELRAQLETQGKELSETRKKLEAAAVGYTAAVPGFEEFDTPEKIGELRERLQNDLDWAEDYADGYEGTDAKGNEVTYTRQQMREFKAKTRERIRLTDKAKETLTQNIARAKASEEKARKFYPSFLNPNHPRSNLLLDAARDNPELNALPSKALHLARAAVTSLLENGTHKLVKVEKPAAAKAAAPKQEQQASKPKPPPVPAPPRPTARSVPDLAERLRAGDDAAKEDWAMGLIGD